MAKSGEQTLFGVKDPKTQVNELNILRWCEYRAPDAWGHMKAKMQGKDSMIVWFNDPGARQDFQDIFGGVSVTLHRNETKVLTGDAAQNFLRKAG